MPKQDDGGILTPWGKRFFKIVGLLIGLALLIAFALSDRAGAEALEWDRSSITLTGQCLQDGSAKCTVRTRGATWRAPPLGGNAEADVLTQSGMFQLVAGAAQVWTFASNGVPIAVPGRSTAGASGTVIPGLR